MPKLSGTVTLSALISSLRTSVRAGGISAEAIKMSTEALSDLGYAYDDERFPRLVGTERFTDTSSETPTNLAEALLWKLGKWNSYKRYSTNFMAEHAEPTNTDVVFFAFARHLKDKRNPIYDQHAIRALWAIDDKLSPADRLKCRSLLFDSSDKWKAAGTGKNSVPCYELFVARVRDLVSRSSGATMNELDRLLMPLGQAIKTSTKTYTEFHSLCQWPKAS